MSLFLSTYLPSIRYMQAFLACEDPTIEIFDSYHKQTYRNRCHVMTANGVQHLSVPVKQVNGNHTLTKDMLISPIEPWQQIHSRCLESAYKASPYFDHYYSYLSPIYNNHFNTLVELNDAALKAILKMLKVKKEIRYTTDYIKECDNDFRKTIVKRDPNAPDLPSYYQVFSDRYPFASDLSILDLIFNEGPDALEIVLG